MKQSFLDKYKVFLIGLAASIAIVIQQFVSQPDVDWKVIGFAVFIATLSYISSQWRGQGVTILGIIGTLAGTFVAVYNTGDFSWNQFIISAVAALLAAVAPPPKPLEYEESAVIKEAKAEAETIKEVKNQ